MKGTPVALARRSYRYLKHLASLPIPPADMGKESLSFAKLPSPYRHHSEIAVAGEEKDNSPNSSSSYLNLKTDNLPLVGMGRMSTATATKFKSDLLNPNKRLAEEALAAQAALAAKAALAEAEAGVGNLHRYDLDFVETAEWTSNLLAKMNRDTASLKELSEKLPTWTPEQGKSPICITNRDFYTIDFTKARPRSEVVVTVALDYLNLSSEGEEVREVGNELNDIPKRKSNSIKSSSSSSHAKALHSFLLIAGDRYDPYTNTVKLLIDIDESSNETIDKYYALMRAQEQVLEMIKEAKANDFSSLQLDWRHVVPRKSKHAFPDAWLPTVEGGKGGKKSSSDATPHLPPTASKNTSSSSSSKDDSDAIGHLSLI